MEDELKSNKDLSMPTQTNMEVSNEGLETTQSSSHEVNTMEAESKQLKGEGDNENDSNKEEKEDEWVDILGSGQLLKKILKNGISGTRPERSDVCTVKYIGKLDSTIVDEGLVTINLGDAEVIQGLDLALPLMDLEEEAEIIVGPRFAFGSEGRKPDIPPNATLHYTVTLISSEPEPFMETLPLKERKEVGTRKKERGNYWYARKDYTLAIQCYRRALDYLDHQGLSALEESKNISQEEIHSLLEDRIKVYNNLAAAQMKITAFDSALQSVENVLRCQPNNVKALFRKGKILAEKGETEDGIEYLKTALTFDPDNVQAKHELSQLLAKQKKDTAQQRKLYKKMLGTNQPTENKPLSPTRDTRRWGMMVGCVGAIFSIFVAYKWYKPV